MHLNHFPFSWTGIGLDNLQKLYGGSGLWRGGRKTHGRNLLAVKERLGTLQLLYLNQERDCTLLETGR